MQIQTWTIDSEEEAPVVASCEFPISADTHLLSLQLQMTQASLCHEYARMEHQQAICTLRRGELEDEMDMYHQTYQDAKNALDAEDSALVAQIENDLLCQKQLVFNDFNA